MKNWSGSVKYFPQHIYYPQSQKAIQNIVQSAYKETKTIRVVGSGHSFTPLCKTNSILVSLDNYQGLISVNKDKQQAVVKAGTKINTLHALLASNGLALGIMGDIDTQSIAGAISTGTHGTGVAFGNLSTLVVGVTFVNGLGELIHCSENENPELFKAAQISLGSLGIITQITLQCIPSYNLELFINSDSLDFVLNNYSEINKNNRNFEFYWFPYTKKVMTKVVNKTFNPINNSYFKDYVQNILLENYALKIVSELSYRFPKATTKLSRFSANTINYLEKINHSYKILTTKRLVRFNEMEYSVPMEVYQNVITDIIEYVNRKKHNVYFPIENRFVKADDIYLSPAYNRNSAYIAIHMYHKKNYSNFFAEIEAIFKAYNGRPHWGKIHTLSANAFLELYPKYNVFNTIRQQHDPKGVFLSNYLKTLFT